MKIQLIKVCGTQWKQCLEGKFYITENAYLKKAAALHIAWSSGLPGLQDGINHTTEGEEASESQTRGVPSWILM